MIVPDVNLLIYAHDANSPFHNQAADWWRRSVGGEELVGLPWAVAMGFIRIITSSRAFEVPVKPREATECVSQWLRQPSIQILDPGPRHMEIVSELLDAVGTGGKLVSDAHLAAIAMEHRATLHTHDRDFERFPGLKARYPLK